MILQADQIAQVAHAALAAYSKIVEDLHATPPQAPAGSGVPTDQRMSAAMRTETMRPTAPAAAGEKVPAPSIAPWDKTDPMKQDAAVKGVGDVMRGEINDAQQAHDKWLVEKQAAGWKVGDAVDPKAKEHPLLVPYVDVPDEYKKKDALWFAVVKVLLGQNG